MTERNGTLPRLLTTTLLTIVLACGGWWLNSTSNRITALESERDTLASKLQTVQNYVCIVLDEVYDTREVITKKPVFRRECPYKP